MVDERDMAAYVEGDTLTFTSDPGANTAEEAATVEALLTRVGDTLIRAAETCSDAEAACAEARQEVAQAKTLAARVLAMLAAEGPH